MRFISKPQEVEAIQWTGHNQQEVYDFLGGDELAQFTGDPRYGWDLSVRSGKDGAQKWQPAPVGHWIVHPPGDLTDVWPVDPDYFANKYEPAED